MGTDYVELFDRKMAEIVLSGTESDLIALWDLRTPPFEYSQLHGHRNVASESLREFDDAVDLAERLREKFSNGTGIVEMKRGMIRELCTSDSLALDYWGCLAEVFEGEDPPGSTTWENFIASL